MRYLSLVEILELHEAIIASTGGARGIRDVGALESAVNQPRLTFDQADLYPDLVSKATNSSTVYRQLSSRVIFSGRD